MAKALLLDLDNTVYDWVTFFAKSFRAMVHALARELEVSEDVLINEFKHVFQVRGFVEYSFSIQELQLCESLSKNRVTQLICLGKAAFNRTRAKNLEPYKGVRETLKWARKHQITVIAVTNSPKFHALRRLSQLRLDPYFDGLIAWDAPGIPDDDPYTDDLRQRQDSYRTTLDQEHILGVNKSYLKPNPEMYRKVFRHFDIDPTDAVAVGDSLSKDVKPAVELGAVGVWAKYGQEFSRDNFETILRITMWDEAKIFSTYSANDIIPSATIDNFLALKPLINKQNTFGWGIGHQNLS